MRIHPAGYTTIALVFGFLLIINIIMNLLLRTQYWFWLVFLPSLILLLIVVQFFRYNHRVPAEQSDNAILSAADGRIVAIEEVDEPLFSFGRAIQISTFMSLHNIHLNWVPANGVIDRVVYLPGKKYIARLPKSSMFNEMSCVLLRTHSGREILIKQIAGIFARRIVRYVQEGQKCLKGEPLGFIRFGSRVDILVPVDAQVMVRIGQKVRGVETTLAILPEHTSSQTQHT